MEVMSPFFQENKEGLQNVQLVMMGGEENFGPKPLLNRRYETLW